MRLVMSARLRHHWTIGACVALGLIVTSNLVPGASAQPSTMAGATYTGDGRLEFPKDYRKWVFLSSGVAMSYVDNAPRMSTFGNVFANPEAYDGFLQNGTWPDKTILVLDVRKAEQQSGAFLKNGRFQSDVVRIEAHVKDASRGGWGFYIFSDEAPATRIP